MAGGFTLRLRREGVTVKRRFDDLGAALDALEDEARAFAATERSPVRRGLSRTYDPVALVALRAELSGRSAHGGIDVRGDGSVEAFTGRFRRSLLDRAAGEDAYAALRRALGHGSGGSHSNRRG
ncbi:MAG: hypothetical protein LT070_13220 [Solirubrobacteraceae bacterium]|nr:hypothetical protein [Solirubrobacteraceae bacterium]